MEETRMENIFEEKFNGNMLDDMPENILAIIPFSAYSYQQ